MHASNTHKQTNNSFLNIAELVALFFLSALFVFLITQVFLLASKNAKTSTSTSIETTPVVQTSPAHVDSAQLGPAQIDSAQIDSTQSSQASPPETENLEAVTPLVREIFSDIEKAKSEADQQAKKTINQYCETVGEKLGSVNVQDCQSADLQLSGVVSKQNKPLTFRDFKTQGTEKDKTRIMLIGGIHGDEFSGVSISFKWLSKLAKAYQDSSDQNIQNYHWRVIPILNPDGLLQPDGQSKRMNANDVDLNRNFPTEDWDEFAHKYWINKRGRDPRRFPGPSAASEIETQWIVEQIKQFNPHAVISIHAPYGIVDSDGPIEPPKNLGPLQLKILGTYPGSMGRYVGVQKNIPMLTVELKRAGTMPTDNDIDLIWTDIQKWISKKVLNNEGLAAMQSIRHEDDDLVIDKKAGD